MYMTQSGLTRINCTTATGSKELLCRSILDHLSPPRLPVAELTFNDPEAFCNKHDTTNCVLADSILVLVLKSASVHECVVWREGERVGRLFNWAPVNSRCSQSPLQINSVQRRVFLVCSAFSLALCEGVYQSAKHSTLSKNKQRKHTHTHKNAASAVRQKKRIMK